MVYESDFYTTRRPYRASPSLSTYTVSVSKELPRQLMPEQRSYHEIVT